MSNDEARTAAGKCIGDGGEGSGCGTGMGVEGKEKL